MRCCHFASFFWGRPSLRGRFDDVGIRSTCQRRQKFSVLALLSGLILAALNGLWPTGATCAEVWLAGVDPYVWHLMEPGVPSDYTDLFKADAPWTMAAKHTQVFKTSTQFIVRGRDEQLRRMFADLRRRGIALAVEGLLQRYGADCGQGIEGYSSRGTAALIARRISQLGGRLAYVAMDEPLWYGHVFLGPHACRASIAAVAANVAQSVAELRRVFPAVQVGDIEPFATKGQPADWLDEIGKWIAAYRAATHSNLSFFDVDVDWREPWQQQFLALVPRLSEAGVKFGVIYNGDPSDPNNIAWTRHAEERFVAVEADPALIPDHAILQTWMSHPSSMLPETQPGTMTWLVNRYAAAETRLTLKRAGTVLTGRLAGPNGQGLAGQRIRISSVDEHNAGPPGIVAQSGTVPTGAVRALFALRINTECMCSGPVNATVGLLSYYDTRTGQSVDRRFSVQGYASRPEGTHIVAPAGQAFAPNTTRWPVRPGDLWTVRAQVGAAESSAHSGYVALIFQRGDGGEAKRIKIELQPAARTLREIATDAAGQFSFVTSADVLRGNPGFRAEFDGNRLFRMSSASVR